jgi:hypothetical protein
MGPNSMADFFTERGKFGDRNTVKEDQGLLANTRS